MHLKCVFSLFTSSISWRKEKALLCGPTAYALFYFQYLAVDIDFHFEYCFFFFPIFSCLNILFLKVGMFVCVKESFQLVHFLSSSLNYMILYLSALEALFWTQPYLILTWLELSFTHQLSMVRIRYAIS